MTETHPVEYPQALPAAASHPVHQYGAGGERVIKFQLYLDGDRGRFGRKGPPREGLSIKADIDFYRSLRYPREVFSFNGLQDVSAAPVIFTFGNYYVAMPCLVKRSDPKVTYFTADLDPVRAVIDIELAEIVPRRVTANEVYNEL